MKQCKFNPDEVIFALTSSCNLRCTHCFTNKTPSNLSANDAVKFLEMCRNFPGNTIEKVGFSGGEPFLNVDFLITVIKYALDEGFMFDRIITNGAWWKTQEDLEETLSKIYDAGFDGKIALSWDSYHNQDTEKMILFCMSVIKIFDGNTLEIQSVAEKNNMDGENFCFEKKLELLSSKVNGTISKKINKKTGTGFISIQGENIFIPIFRTPVTYCASDENAFKSRKWFKDDFCKGPGNILFVHPTGNIAPCCGFANENKALFIGKITDSLETILKNADENKMVRLCYEKGLSKGIKLLKKRNIPIPGKTDDPCTFCDFICRELNGKEDFYD